MLIFATGCQQNAIERVEPNMEVSIHDSLNSYELVPNGLSDSLLHDHDLIYIDVDGEIPMVYTRDTTTNKGYKFPTPIKNEKERKNY